MSTKSMSSIDISKAGAAFIPTAFVANPAFAYESVIQELPSQTVALEVQVSSYRDTNI
jgi:hypothetical protein